MPGDKEETEETSPPVDEKAEESAEKEEESKEPPDYKALFEESEAKNKQLLNDSRARQGQQNRSQDLENRMDRMETSVEANARASAHILDQMSKDNDEFAAEVRKGNQEAEAKSREDGAKGRQTGIMNSILDIVQVENEGDDAPTVLISKENEDALAKLWGAAVAESNRTGSEAPLFRVQTEATRMVLEAEQAKSRKALADARATAKADTKKALEKAGIADQDTGPARSGAGAERKRGVALLEEALTEGTPLFPGSKQTSL